MDMIDLTEDTEMDFTSQPEIQPGPSNLEEGRKRKANDLDTYHHPMIEFEATGKLLNILSLFILELSPMYYSTSDIITLLQHLRIL